MPILLAVVALGALALFASAGSVRVETISSVMKRVFVDGRSYVVTRLGNGTYNVTDTVTLAHVTFDQTKPIESIGDVSQLNKDMHRFPRDLFKES